MSSRVRKNHKRSVERNRPMVESAGSFAPLEQMSVSVGKGGRIVIPARYRKALGIADGDSVFIKLEGEELRIVSDETEVRRVREIIDRYVPEGVSLVDELLRERRREVAAEKRWAERHLSDCGRSKITEDVRNNESVNLTDRKS